MQKSRQIDSQRVTALDSIGGEPLAGSGFENEVPAPEFAETTDREED